MLEIYLRVSISMREKKGQNGGENRLKIKKQ